MEFVNAARAKIATLRDRDPARIVLEYLLQNAVGRRNAKPWPIIEAHLIVHQVRMSREDFQQGILAESRSGDIFIGSSDHSPGRGYFLIQDRADADVAREFYVRRIEAQSANLRRLDQLIERHEFPE